MKTPLKLPALLFFSFVILNTSCRQEENVFVEDPVEESLKFNSNVADILKRTAMKDGSGDNIIDKSNCFTIELPVTIEIDGLEIIVDSEEDFDTIEAIFDEFEDDDDILELIFPLTIILADFTEVLINDLEEFQNYSDDCSGENENDDDIECVDIQYPVTVSIFNSNNGLIFTTTISNDKELFDFIQNLDEDDIVNIDFPIVIILADGSEVEATNLEELESIIENAKDDCDEDDDNDFNDDDCENCSTDQLSDILVGCANWIVDKLERDDEDLEDQYSGYQFNFQADGTLSAASGGSNYSGTWESTGNGNTIDVTINIPELSDFNGIWNLHELEQDSGENKVDLRIGGDDRLRFESNCSEGNDGDDDDDNDNDDDNDDNEDDDCENCTTNQLSEVLVGCSDWTVDKLERNDSDLEDQYTGYRFNFTTTGSLSATSGNDSFSGTWESTGNGNSIDVTINIPELSDFNGTWNLHEIEQNSGENKVDLRIGNEDRLRFESDCSEGNGGNDDDNNDGNDDDDNEDNNDDDNDNDCENCTGNELSEVLVGCSDWTVDKLERNDNDLEDQYSGYRFNFQSNGVLSATSGSNNFNGTWESNGNGDNTSVTINIPNLSDFNGTWDLHGLDQSGGGGEAKVDLRIGGDDRLRFESNCN